MARLEHTFIVRIWQEQDSRRSTGRWRGSVEHIASGQRLYFTSFSDLTAFILQQQRPISASEREPVPDEGSSSAP